MKTTVITPLGNLNLQPLEGGGYRLTGHAIPTTTLATDNEIIANLATDNDGDGEPCLRLLAKDNATIALTPDTRHGERGWRGCRYLDTGKAHKEWDEWYLFFPTLSEAIRLFGNKPEDSEFGITDARRRF